MDEQTVLNTEPLSLELKYVRWVGAPLGVQNVVPQVGFSWAQLITTETALFELFISEDKCCPCLPAECSRQISLRD